MPLTTSRLEKIGFLSKLPPQANIDDYEVITIKGESGEKLKMYREKKEQIDIDGLEDFTHSWTTFQQNLS